MLVDSSSVCMSFSAIYRFFIVCRQKLHEQEHQQSKVGTLEINLNFILQELDFV